MAKPVEASQNEEWLITPSTIARSLKGSISPRHFEVKSSHQMKLCEELACRRRPVLGDLGPDLLRELSLLLLNLPDRDRSSPKVRPGSDDTSAGCRVEDIKSERGVAGRADGGPACLISFTAF